ncbi:hypothetical protein HYV82_01750 [Candidatus Woesearchaeota archaeon]|nr:hypothetical protein [Candidatus Woesearchaeota archaeon]
MKLANNVRISVFAKEDENAEEIEEKLKQLVPLDIEKERIAVQKKAATGFNEKKITIMEISLAKDRHINAFLDFLKENLGERQKGLLIRQKESRLDEKLNFFMRLDKEKLMKNEYWVTDSGNCYHIRISVASFPRNRENAMKAVENALGLKAP